MPQGAGADEYSLAVRRLRIHVHDLRALCEERLGIQRVASEDPAQLVTLFDLISEVLNEVGGHASVSDEDLAAAARERQLSFDKITDPIFQHMNQRYRDPNQLSEAWANHRYNLRKELDILLPWVSSLPIILNAIMAFQWRSARDKHAG